MSIPVEFFPPFVQAAVEAIQVWDVAKDVRLWEFFWLVVGFLHELTRFNAYFLQIQWHNYSMIVWSPAWSSATGRDNWWDGHQFLSLVHCHVLRPWGVVVVKSASDFWPPVLWIYIWESFWSQECGWIWQNDQDASSWNSEFKQTSTNLDPITRPPASYLPCIRSYCLSWRSITLVGKILSRTVTEGGITSHYVPFRS